jgi:16S rRNA (cytosine967-C5)-methyltransferase
MLVFKRHADAIIKEYAGKVPLQAFLSSYFKQNPVLGSKDRKIIAERVFTFYRIAPMIRKLDAEQQTICIDAFMAERLDPKYLHNALKGSHWIENRQTIAERLVQLEQLGIQLNLSDLIQHFPSFSDGIDAAAYSYYLLSRNAVYLKPQTNFRETVIRALQKQEVIFTELEIGLLRLEGSPKLQEILKPNWYRIQDASSVATANYFPETAPNRIWDTCAGGGGKTLLLHEKYPKAQLFASDNRSYVLENLKQRFKEHAYPLPFCFEWDGESKQTALPHNATFDLILCDVPCSGSGTWARNPENAHFFKSGSEAVFRENQINIVSKAITHLNPGGYLIYITCSAFRAENEEVLEALVANSNLKLESKTMISGIDKQSDCLFVGALK